MIIPKYTILDSKGSYNHEPTRATTAHLEEGSTSNWRNSAQTDWPGSKMTSMLGTNIVLGCFGFICWPATMTNQGYLSCWTGSCHVMIDLSLRGFGHVFVSARVYMMNSSWLADGWTSWCSPVHFKQKYVLSYPTLTRLARFVK